MYIHVKEISPKLLKSDYFNGYELTKEPLKLAPRACCNYEFEFYIKSDGGVYVDGEYIQFAANDLSIRKPGQKICGVAPYECYNFSISLNGKYDMPVDSPEQVSTYFENELINLLGNKASLQEHPHIRSMFHQLYNVSKKNDPLNVFNANRILMDILYELFKLATPEKELHNKTINPQITRAIDHIKSNITDEINIADLIIKSGLSKAYFNKCFKSYTGTTPSKFITALRMDKAKLLLCSTNHSIAEVASMCGYYDHTYFAYLFKNSTGFSPSVYRKNYSSHVRA